MCSRVQNNQAGNRSYGADDFDLGGEHGECQSKDDISKNIHDACINAGRVAPLPCYPPSCLVASAFRPQRLTLLLLLAQDHATTESNNGAKPRWLST